MIEIKIDGKELAQFGKTLEGFNAKDLPYATSVAANKTADRALKKLQRDLPQQLDRPTPFALRSLFVRKATKAKPEATIEWRSFGGRSFGAGRPLAVQADGGVRGKKGFEQALQGVGMMPRGWFAVPSDNALKDAYGNVPGRLYTQILSYLRADRSGTQNRPVNANTKRKRTRQAKRISKFFAVHSGRVIGSSQPTKLGAGIYERIASAFGAAYRQLFFFIPQMSYRKRAEIAQSVERYAPTIFPDEFEKAMRQSIETRSKFK